MLKLDGNVAKVEELHATVQQLPEDVFSGAGVEGLPGTRVWFCVRSLD